MERRLRSSLESSAQDFISLATELPLKSTKSTLKALIHNISPKSDLCSSLSQALHFSIHDSIHLFHNLTEHPSDDQEPVKSPPTKRLRRSSRKTKSGSEEVPERSDKSNFDHKKGKLLAKLCTLTHISRLCFSHPKKAFTASDLFPAVQVLHDNLVQFEADSGLMSEIQSLCEEWWKGGLPGREMLISRSIPYLLSRSLTLKKKVDVHRVYSLREAFELFDFEDESIVDLKLLLMRCVIEPLYLKTEDGRRFVAYMFGLGLQLVKEAMAMIKAQIPFGRKSMLEGYGDILFRAWKATEEILRDEIEGWILQNLIEGSIYASSEDLGASTRRVLGAFTSQRTTAGVEKLLFRLAEPVLFRSLQVANSNVRLNALHLLIDLFPLENPDATKEVKDALLSKQFFLLEKMLMDDYSDVRVVAVEGCCRIINLFWEVIESSSITKIITKIFDDMSRDISNEVRLSTLNGIMYLIGNPQCHELLKVLLPRISHLMLDNVLSVRVAVVDLLLVVRDNRSFQFNKVVTLDVLLSALADDHNQVAQKITRLLLPSYFPTRSNVKESCNRCLALIKRSPMAGARFCEFSVLEGASLESLVELVKLLISTVLSRHKLNTDQVDGFLISAGHLCNVLASEPSHRNPLKELFGVDNVKHLYKAASSNRAQSSVLNIVSMISPENVAALLEECMTLVTNCRGLADDVERQGEVRCAHKLLFSNDGLDDVFDAFIGFLEKAAYRCHIKFGTEIPTQSAYSSRRTRSNSSVKASAKRKNKASGKKPSNFEEDYSSAVGIAWQIKDLLICEDTRKVLLASPTIKSIFLLLKVISEVSILQCVHKDIYPVLAYTSLALHMTAENISITNTKKSLDTTDSSRSTMDEKVLVETVDGLLSCTMKLFEEGNCSETPGVLKASNKKRVGSVRRQREPETSSFNSDNDGNVCTKAKEMSTKVKIFTAVLKFMVDCITMGFTTRIQGNCLKFTSACARHMISLMGRKTSDDELLDVDIMKETVLCLKSYLSYTGKLLNLALKDTNEASLPQLEAFDVASDLLDLIASTELNYGSIYAARLAASLKPWVPDLILALGSSCMLKEDIHTAFSDHIKLRFPLWLHILVEIELYQMNEDDEESKPGKYPAFRKLMDLMVLSLKSNSKIVDAIGVIFLSCSMVGMERKDFATVLGFLHFVCVGLLDKEDKEWTGLEVMLCCVPSIYLRIEKEIEEQNDEDEKHKLLSAKTLLEPVWMYHLYETQRFSTMEE